MLKRKLTQKINIVLYFLFLSTTAFCGDLTEKWIRYIQNDKSQIEYYFKQLVEYCQNLTPDIIESDFNVYHPELCKYFIKNTMHKTYADYDDISTKLKEYSNDYKRYSPLPSFASATKGNIYHASKIPLDYGVYIAAHGPSATSINNFWALLAENNVAISLSLVNKEELNDSNINQILSASCIEQNYVVNSKADKKTNKIVRNQHVICHLLSDEKSGFRYDLFLINNKFHIRVYDYTWVKKQKYDTRRVIALACFAEKLRRLSIFKRSEDTPVVINCNNGMGRTSILMLVNDAVRSYLRKKDSYIVNNEAKNIVEKIIHIRYFRPKFASKFVYFFKILECVEDPSKYLDHAINYFSLGV